MMISEWFSDAPPDTIPRLVSALNCKSGASVIVEFTFRSGTVVLSRPPASANAWNKIAEPSGVLSRVVEPGTISGGAEVISDSSAFSENLAANIVEKIRFPNIRLNLVVDSYISHN